jgi:signal transduction histidine kinase
MISTSPIERSRFAKTPPFWLSLLLCVAATAFLGYMRLFAYSDKSFPVSAALPLMLCLWNRDVKLLYGMSFVISIISAVRIFWMSPNHDADVSFNVLSMLAQLVNIWLVAGVLHGLLNTLKRLRKKRYQLEQLNLDLETSNTALSASNEELASREEEITRQNEELQNQTEELERQSEELRQQAEELERQSLHLHESNAELARRELGMQTLLESGRWLRNDKDERLVMSGICQAAIQVMGSDAHAAAVVENEDGMTCIRGEAGLTGAVVAGFPYPLSFSSLVQERCQTAYVEDVRERPDLFLPHPSGDRPLLSVLGTPILLEGKCVAVLEIYCERPRAWTAQEFQVAEWLSAQASLTLQALRFQQALLVKQREAENASVQKTRFLAAVSHDVRTPANAIGLLSELVERLAVDPEKVKQVPALARSLSTNARSLVELVSDVLDLTRFDSGHVDLQVSDFPLASLVNAEISQATPAAARKGLRLAGLMPPEEVWLRTDRMKLARVLSNLLGNAVKFTESGSVEMHCERTPGGLEIRVEDTGVGIPEEQLPHIFDEFFQLQNPERDREKGAGLGLAICSRLLDTLGCKVSVTSRVGVGTTFTVVIPKALLVPVADMPRQVVVHQQGDLFESASSPLVGLHILLVEDHFITRRTMSQLLTAEGAVVSEAATGREALHFLAHGLHDVMLLDLNLPDIDGSEVLKSLCGQRPERLKKILVVSGDVRAERIEEVKSLGADNLIPKPLSIDRILEGINEA